MTFIAGTAPNAKDPNETVLAVKAPSPSLSEQNEQEGEVTLMEDGIYVYTDSITPIPKGLSINDAISTASAALSGVHCGMPKLNADGASGKVRMIRYEQE
jgi:hypothetical protein